MTSCTVLCYILPLQLHWHFLVTGSWLDFCPLFFFKPNVKVIFLSFANKTANNTSHLLWNINELKIVMYFLPCDSLFTHYEPLFVLMNSRLEFWFWFVGFSHTQVRIALQLEDGSRLQGSFPSSHSLWDLLSHFLQTKCVISNVEKKLTIFLSSMCL